MDEVEVVVAHSERATLRVGDVFLKVDADRTRIEAEVEAMALAPLPTPEALWHKPPVLAIAAVPGTTLGRLGGPSTGSPAAWAAAGAVIRLTNSVLPADLVTRNREVADAALRPWTPAFTHGDLQIAHLFLRRGGPPRRGSDHPAHVPSRVCPLRHPRQ
ncbi:hypothetical protein SAMN02745830_07219 [Streptomyces sp. Amel2xC10]|nr:hypothetical protein SAMN02745830_07219 [Streptomyces sp. Amel2xC10]